MSNRTSFCSKSYGDAYQILNIVENVGKSVKGSKRKVRWVFGFQDKEGDQEVILVHSRTSGKKTIMEDGREISTSTSLLNSDFGHTWRSERNPGLLYRIEFSYQLSTEDTAYIFAVDGVKFADMPRRGSPGTRTPTSGAGYGNSGSGGFGTVSGSGYSGTVQGSGSGSGFGTVQGSGSGSGFGNDSFGKSTASKSVSGFGGSGVSGKGGGGRDSFGSGGGRSSFGGGGVSITIRPPSDTFDPFAPAETQTQFQSPTSQPRGMFQSPVGPSPFDPDPFAPSHAPVPIAAFDPFAPTPAPAPIAPTFAPTRAPAPAPAPAFSPSFASDPFSGQQDPFNPFDAFGGAGGSGGGGGDPFAPTHPTQNLPQAPPAPSAFDPFSTQTTHSTQTQRRTSAASAADISLDLQGLSFAPTPTTAYTPAFTPAPTPAPFAPTPSPPPASTDPWSLGNLVNLDLGGGKQVQGVGQRGGGQGGMGGVSMGMGGGGMSGMGKQGNARGNKSSLDALDWRS